MINLVLVTGFVAITGFVFLLGRIAQQMQRNPVRERLQMLVGRQLALVGGDLPAPRRAEPPMLQDTAGRRLTPIDREMRQAGWYRPGAHRDFVALRNALLIFTLLAAGGAAVAVGPQRPELVQKAMILGLAAVGLVWATPRIYLRSKAKTRAGLIRRGLPDAVDLMTMCLSGGMNLSDALIHVSRDIFTAHPDLATELMIVREQSEMRSSAMAFEQFAERTDVAEVRALANLITHGQKLGTDVAGAIQEYADSMRLRRRQAAEERSNKAGVKMLFPLTMCLLPSVFIILWGPSVLELWQFLSSFAGASGTPQ